MSSQSDWPTYMKGHKEHYHALGVIAAAFNLLEHRLLGLFMLYVSEFDDVTALMFQRIRDNGTRSDFLARAVTARGESPEIKDAVAHFCKGFDTCAQNRNTLMHSATAPVIENGEIVETVFSKGKKGQPLDWNRYSLDLTQLRNVADEMHEFTTFGRNLMNYVFGQYRRRIAEGPFQVPTSTTLPEKPPLPTLLTPRPPE